MIYIYIYMIHMVMVSHFCSLSVGSFINSMQPNCYRYAFELAIYPLDISL
jgi:hypothetical protein